MNPIMEFIGTLQKSRFWWVKAYIQNVNACALHGLPSHGLCMLHVVSGTA